MSEIVALAHLQARRGAGPALLDLLAGLSAEVMTTEPETLRYAFLTESGSDPLRVTVVERYPSRAAHDAHRTGVLTEYLPALLDLLDGAPHTVELTPVTASTDPRAAL